MTADERKDKVAELAALSTLAEQLAPAFRDKFDFSDDRQFDALAALAFKAAEAMHREQKRRLEAIK